ncbi:MAG: ATP-binding cassette domain-containing protein [Ruminococcus sp.]|nr:ATP-binding cassette domain-containing protein [Ruminococcus sp.]
MAYILSTSGLTKQYGKQKAVNNVNIHIRQGDIYGLIGRNGAGKTTVLKMISGLAAPTEGEFTLFGKSGREAAKVMNRVGTLIEAPGAYREMSAAGNIKLKCIAMGVRKKGVVEELLKTVGLENAGRKAVKNFSLGMKQRLGIALALVGDTDLVVLDEPINGLDPQGIAEIRETIERLNREKGITFIISSHILEELSKIATSYGIIHNGELLQELTKEELMSRCMERIELVTDDTARAATVLEDMGITQYKVVDKTTIQIYERLNGVSDIAMRLTESGVKFGGISVKNEALEDYFLNLTGGAQNA